MDFSSLAGGVLVVGSGVTGRALVNFFRGREQEVCVLDQRPISSEAEKWFLDRGVSLLAPFELSRKNLEELARRKFSLAVLSPGVDPRGRLVQALEGVPLRWTTELDIALTMLGMPEVAVTGTNGKTTVVNIVHQMLLASELDSRLVGNVGEPLIALASGYEKNLPAFKVAEMSSYQLETVEAFAPQIGVWLNLDDDHLERHGSLEVYAKCKSRVFSEQLENAWAVLNKDDPWFSWMREQVRGNCCVFGSGPSGEQTESYYLADVGKIVFSHESQEEEYSLANCKLIGEHNYANLAAAIAAARLIGANPDAVQSVIDSFEPLPHRLEVFLEQGGVTYINDSKATNPSSTLVALKAMDGRALEGRASGKTIVMLGGQLKEGQWEELAKRLSDDRYFIITFGAGRQQVVEYLSLEKQFEVCETLDLAIEKAKAIAQSGDIVLLSPAGASFDQFSSFEQRGEEFKRLCTLR